MTATGERRAAAELVREAQEKGLAELLEATAAAGVALPRRIVVERVVAAGRDTDGFEQVALIAHRLGVTPVMERCGSWVASREFGPYVAFRAVYALKSVTT